MVDEQTHLLEKYNERFELISTSTILDDKFNFKQYGEKIRYGTHLENFTVQGSWLNGVTKKEIIKINLSTNEEVHTTILDRRDYEEDYFYMPE